MLPCIYVHSERCTRHYIQVDQGFPPTISTRHVTVDAANHHPALNRYFPIGVATLQLINNYSLGRDNGPTTTTTMRPVTPGAKFRISSSSIPELFLAKRIFPWPFDRSRKMQMYAGVLLRNLWRKRDVFAHGWSSNHPLSLICSPYSLPPPHAMTDIEVGHLL